MNAEQRLIEVFQTSMQVEPTPDLFSRVVHSIEEDRRHRQRVARTMTVLAAAAAAVVAVGALSVVDGQYGRFINRPTMEALEIVILIAVLGAMGPAIRRFGRNYADDLWPSGSETPRAMLRLLDLAYYLVGVGYIFISTEFDFSDGRFADRVADQLGDAGVRIGGMLLLLGVLHASLLFLLPIVALMQNSTRRDAAVPRWVLVVLLAVGLSTLVALQVVVAVGMAGAS